LEDSAFGQQPDISALLAFLWYKPVYFFAPTSHFPSTPRECKGCIAGIAEHQVDTLTFLVLDELSHKVVARSELRSALNPLHPNLRAQSALACSLVISFR
jgi:hypothetical protein